MTANKWNLGPMLNAYPDSVGGRLGDIVALLKREELRDAFRSFYILPSVFNTDLDRGFSIIDYELSETLASPEDIRDLRGLGIDLAMDLVLNHISVLSPQFQDLLDKGEASAYRDFFIDWNRFWAGCGTMTAEEYLQPDEEWIRGMFFRKAGLPLLMVRFPDGRDVPYWNTFYQEVRYAAPEPLDLVRSLGMQYGTACALAALLGPQLAEGLTPAQLDFGPWEAKREAVTGYLEDHRRYLGQMDLNVKSPKVREYYRETLQKLADYGVSVVRLDAFAYASKEPGRHNFLNEPETWELLAEVEAMAAPLGLTLLPEIHASYGEGTYALLAEKGYPVYDFFLPGLVIDAFERQSGVMLQKWGEEIVSRGIAAVNMLGCHDGIPLLDLKGLLPEEDIRRLIDTVVGRGGFVKDLHGAKNVYYQVNATYFSALGEDERRLLLARAIQLFMPGKPQIWYLDLFAGVNDHEAMRRAGPGGHKEINRTNLSPAAVEAGLMRDVVKDQLALLRLRNSCPGFAGDAAVTFHTEGSRLSISWATTAGRAKLEADLADASFTAAALDAAGRETFRMVRGG
jgi:sucrose phosphorylase